VQHLFDQNFLGLSATKNKQLIQSFSNGYDIKRVLGDFKDTLQKMMTPRYHKKITAWLNQPATQAVLKVRRRYYTLQGKRERIIAMYKLGQHPPKPARRHVLAALWDTTAKTQLSVKSSIILFRSIIEAYGYLNNDLNLSSARINAIIQNYQSRVLGPAAKHARKEGSRTLAVKYYHVKLPELKTYTAFFESKAGQWLIRAIGKSRQAAYRAGAKRFLAIVKSHQ
jgi:hypothetical protein